jgi:hypothetical protein
VYSVFQVVFCLDINPFLFLLLFPCRMWHLNSLPPYIIQFFMFTNLTCVTGPSANMILKIKPNFDEKNILY